MITTISILKVAVTITAGIAVFLTDYAMRDPSLDGGIVDAIREQGGWESEAGFQSVAPLVAIGAIVGATVAGFDGLLVVLVVGAALNLLAYGRSKRGTTA